MTVRHRPLYYKACISTCALHTVLQTLAHTIASDGILLHAAGMCRPLYYLPARRLFWRVIDNCSRHTVQPKGTTQNNTARVHNSNIWSIAWYCVLLHIAWSWVALPLLECLAQHYCWAEWKSEEKNRWTISISVLKSIWQSWKTHKEYLSVVNFKMFVFQTRLFKMRWKNVVSSSIGAGLFWQGRCRGGEVDF